VLLVALETYRRSSRRDPAVPTRGGDHRRDRPGSSASVRRVPEAVAAQFRGCGGPGGHVRGATPARLTGRSA
jgi:hypothetical protein